MYDVGWSMHSPQSQSTKLCPRSSTEVAHDGVSKGIGYPPKEKNDHHVGWIQLQDEGGVIIKKLRVDGYNLFDNDTQHEARVIIYCAGT